jgi:four helix bundle protein
MKPVDFQQRTKTFALRAIKLTEALPNTRTATVIARQLLRSATSVGANYRAACRAISRAAFVAKLAFVEEECDESLYWMEIPVDADIVKAKRLADLMAEAREILAVTIAAEKTARRK